MSIGTDLKNSLSGNIESAMLVIHDYRESAKNLKMDTTEEKLKVLGDFRVAETALRLENSTPPTYPGSKDRIIKVQFNPSQMTINASAIPQIKQDVQTGESRNLASETVKSLTLTVVLYFDDMDTYDAFMWEKFTAGLTATGAANAAKGIKSAAGKGKKHSVQWQVESLIAALRNPYTRLISFRWADFSFIGQLNAVRANYTMFSTSGRPIRAEILMRIQHEMDSDMLNGWYKNFEKAFGGETSNLVRKEQDYSSLINLGL